MIRIWRSINSLLEPTVTNRFKKFSYRIASCFLSLATVPVHFYLNLDGWSTKSIIRTSWHGLDIDLSLKQAIWMIHTGFGFVNLTLHGTWSLSRYSHFRTFFAFLSPFHSLRIFTILWPSVESCLFDVSTWFVRFVFSFCRIYVCLHFYWVLVPVQRLLWSIECGPKKVRSIEILEQLFWLELS